MASARWGWAVAALVAGLWWAGDAWRSLGQPRAADAPRTTVRYVMWDSLQLPVMRECAADFMREHPDIRVQLSQVGWGDYWTTLATGFIAQSAPDVFVNHLSRYPELAEHGQLEDLRPWLAREGDTLAEHPPRLVQAWSRGAAQYGVPKDWDTVAMVVNLEHARRQGVGLDELRRLDWNPSDGGRFEKLLQRLTVDRQGRRWGESGFDAQAVAVHGFAIPTGGGLAGQTEWSHWAASNGAVLQEAPWSGRLNVNSTRLADTLQWLASLPGKSLAPVPQGHGLGAGAMFVSGRVALAVDGAWMAGYYASQAPFDHTWVPLPVGRSGQRASMLNGVADSVWSGSKVKPQAWAWVRHMASADCQAKVARAGVVFPSRAGLAEQVVAQRRAAGRDSSAFLTMAEGHTFLMPIGLQGARLDEVMNLALERTLTGREPAAQALARAQAEIDRVLGLRR